MRNRVIYLVLPLALLFFGCNGILNPGRQIITDIQLVSATLGTSMQGEIEYGPGSYRTIYGLLHAIVSIDKFYAINGNPVNYGSNVTNELTASADQGNKTYNLDTGVEFNDGPSLANAYIIIRVGGAISDFPGGPYQDTIEKKVFLTEFDAEPGMDVTITLPNCQGSVILDFSTNKKWIYE
jgi:hypothetical protein